MITTTQLLGIFASAILIAVILDYVSHWLMNKMVLSDKALLTILFMIATAGVIMMCAGLWFKADEIRKEAELLRATEIHSPYMPLPRP